jgi:hypothetical protein
MNTQFVIDDELHAEEHSTHETLDEAIAELKRLALIPWDKEPNVAPCTNWRKCGRHYEIIEYDTSSEPWRELRRMLALKISAEGIIWSEEFRQ